MREKRPGVWEVRALTGRDERGRPTKVSRNGPRFEADAHDPAAGLEPRWCLCDLRDWSATVAIGGRS